jgi:hypothetical protein
MEITSLTPSHARQVAEIHIEGQPGTFLTRLGIDFLVQLYAAIAASEFAFGRVALDGTVVAGAGIVALNTGQLFRQVKVRHWHRLAWPVARRMLRHPRLLGELIQSWRYPARNAVRPGDAEILFMGLRHDYMRHSLGPRLLADLLEVTSRRGCPGVTTLIDKRNRAVRWLIGDVPGCAIDHEVELNGKTMLVYRLNLPLVEKVGQPTRGTEEETPWVK